MSGISTILNIAKEALSAQQTAISVASHNIANADTEGYSQQSLNLTTASSSPVGVGNLGNGVKAVSIMRQYDRFLTRQIVEQNSTLGYLEAQSETYPVVEAIFDETDDLGVSGILNSFWDSWQELSDNPELESARQQVLEKGQLLVDKLHHIVSSIGQLRSDLNVSMDSAINEANTITRQIADLNLQISSTETPTAQQNDLRDQRDTLVNELSGYLDISYFESSNSAYTVMLSDGHSLVTNDKQWDLGWSEDSLSWISEDASGRRSETALKGGASLGGKIGGWSEVLGQIAEGDPDNYLGQMNAFANTLIREVNQQYSQGVGLTPFDEELQSVEVADTALLTATINAETAASTVATGTLEINGTDIGRIPGGAASFGLATTKSANTATAINAAECGVTAKLTTQVSGDAVSSGLGAGETVNFSVCGIDISYTAAAVETAEQTAANVVSAINGALASYNSDPANTPQMTLEAVVGDGANGGAANSIILCNTNEGDESAIVISGIDPADAAENKLGLNNGSFQADAVHNTGTVALFSTEDIEIEAGTNDSLLNQLGLGGGNVSADDIAGDGRLTFRTSDNAAKGSLQGLGYADQLQTDNGSFDIWLYDADGNPALTTSVTVDLTRAYTLQDVADAINTALSNETGASPAWLVASVRDNQLVLTPNKTHQFAFAEDTTNFLATAELNTFFSGSSAADIAIQQTVLDNTDYLAAGTVSENGKIYTGDNSNSLQIINIRDKERLAFQGGKEATLDDFYAALISDIGTDSQVADNNLEFNTLLANQLMNMRDSASGVSLDEEMANLIKYQQAYTAAAKLITIADEMMQTLLDTI
ncbi:MAG: flagellar hook-associated protein FlgK [Deltaproteobacteria bacterium]|nr:flagellar hook-associated protein FlgK [Deltaproteobacteria bacterium]